jgi:hypothetical protein
MLSRKEKAGVGALISVWALIVLANLAFWGVVVWAIIKLVNHFA